MEVSVLVLLTVSLNWVWEVSFTPWSLYPRRKASDTFFTGGCIGPRADVGVLEVGKFISSPGIKRRFLGRPTFNLIITTNELSRFTLLCQVAKEFAAFYDDSLRSSQAAVPWLRLSVTDLWPQKHNFCSKPCHVLVCVFVCVDQVTLGQIFFLLGVPLSLYFYHFPLLYFTHHWRSVT
jgi:hypothetical protein